MNISILEHDKMHKNETKENGKSTFLVDSIFSTEGKVCRCVRCDSNTSATNGTFAVIEITFCETKVHATSIITLKIRTCSIKFNDDDDDDDKRVKLINHMCISSAFVNMHK